MFSDLSFHPKLQSIEFESLGQRVDFVGNYDHSMVLFLNHFEDFWHDGSFKVCHVAHIKDD